jgi:hypothetical protein
MLHSDNRSYNPYEIKFSEIAEIWEYVGSLEREHFKPEQYDVNQLGSVIRKLHLDIAELKEKFN